MATIPNDPHPPGSTSIHVFTAHASTTALQIPAKQHVFDLAQKASSRWPVSHIAVGALTFHPLFRDSPLQQKPEQRILLLQRASSDSMPNLWEIPGGACDVEDESILHSVARELYEEAGVVARSIGPLVELSGENNKGGGEAEEGEGYVFWTSSGNLVRKYNFLVELDDHYHHATAEVGSGGEVPPNRTKEKCGDDEEESATPVKVKLDPTEHQNYVWATEEEVRARRCGHVELKFTSPEQLEVILIAFETRRRLLGEHEEKQQQQQMKSAGGDGSENLTVG